MPEYQFITANYDGITKDINMVVRDILSYERKILRITGFKPYFYVPETDTVPNEPWVVDVKNGFLHMDGKYDKKIIVVDPLEVSNNRGRFSSAHEADINYIQRFLIDTDILSSFTTPITSHIIPYDVMSPIDKILLPLIVYMDIEVKTKGRFPNARVPDAPIIAVTFYDNYYKKYVTICVDDRVTEQVVETPLPDWTIIKVPTPGHLLSKLLEYLNFIKADIITGWNISFDTDYLIAWAKKNFKKIIPLGEFEEIFDLLEAYKKSKASMGNRLKEVVVKEGLIRTEDMVSETFKIDMYNDPNQRDNFILYNKKDTEYCVKLNSGFTRVTDGKFVQYNFIENFWNQRNFVGLNTINYTTAHVKRHDPLWLRVAKNLGFTLPSSGQSEESEDEGGLEFGGVVFTPPAGIYRNLTVLDMSRYYPSILLSFPNETSPDIWGKLAPTVISYLSSERDRWDAELKKFTPGTEDYKTAKVSQTIAKTFLSGAWGYFAYAGSRIYSKKRGDFVLKTGGDGLRRVRERASKIGHETIYGDSVSGDSIIPIFISTENHQTLLSIQNLFTKYTSTIREDGKEICYPVDLLTYAIGIDLKIHLRKIIRIIRHKTTKKMFKITTDNCVLKVTEDHSVESVKDNKLITVEPKQLNIYSKLISRMFIYPVLENVIKVEPCESEKYVYDLEVDVDHTFLANGLFVHNTDSIFIDSEPDDVESLVGEVNDELTRWATEMGIKDSRFHIKEDRFAKTTLFIKAKNSEEGAKKRYGQRIIRENGDPCDYILVKGFEYVRGNTSEITRKLQKEVIDYVLMDNIKEIIPRIQGIIKNINSRVYDLDQITIPINLSKPFGPSIKSGGEYYDGANWNNKYVKESIISGDLVRYFQAKTCGRLPYNKWVSYLDAKNINDNGIVPDYDWIINRSLKSPLESILSSAGISWDNIQGFQNMKDFFGE